MIIKSPSSPGPVFIIDLVLKDNQLVFNPTLEEVMGTVLGTFDDVFVQATKMMKVDSEVPLLPLWLV